MQTEILKLLADGDPWTNGELKVALKPILPLSPADRERAEHRPNEEKWEELVNNALSPSRGNSRYGKGLIENVERGLHRSGSAGGLDDMPRLAYVNGRLLALAEASVSIEDRGFQFADGVYEVVAVLDGALFDWAGHRARLTRSLAELSIVPPASERALEMIVARVLRANRIGCGLLYIQVTRGAARRDHGFPKGIRPTLVMTARPFDFRQRLAQQETGVGVITVPDARWARRDIKSVALLPNVLAKEAARSTGAFEAWLTGADGRIAEGSSTNAWIVLADGTVVTAPLSNAILAGVMRDSLLRLARAEGMRIEERAFSRDEALGAAEAFLTATTAPCLPVVSIDGAPVGSGRPGPLSARLADLLWGEIARQTGFSPAR